MDPNITEDDRAFFSITLALRLKQLRGDGFQDFFADVMLARYGDEYVPVRPHGSLGDKGCDGYTRPDGCVYQCYGAHDARLNVATIIKKMSEDFAKAKSKLPQIMKKWAMVHNLDALPVDVLSHFEQMAKDNPDIEFSMFSRDTFEKIVLELPRAKVEGLVGRAIVLKSSRDLDINALSALIANIAAAADGSDPLPTDPKPVPVDKLEFNRVPGHWRRFIIGNLDLAAVVGSYFDGHRDPTIGETVSAVMRRRYQELRQQTKLSPGDILDRLHESVVNSGAGLPTPATEQASFAILAYFFEACDIFEDSPTKVPA